MPIVSTFGPWEAQRRILVADLAGDPDILAKVNKSRIINVLFTDVHTAMHERAISYTNECLKDCPITPLAKLLRRGYEGALDAIEDSLATQLGVRPFQIEDHVNKFCQMARQSIDLFIDDMVLITSGAQTIRKTVLTELYGADFHAEHPLLTKSLIVNDGAIHLEALRGMEEELNSLRLTNSGEFIGEVFKYMKEIATQSSPTPEFQSRFLRETGKTMEQYKQCRIGAPLRALSFLHRPIAANAQLPQETPTATDERSVNFN